ncbi:MAG: DUF3024 domain-containing protein [Halanaerobiales bacterium]
MALDELQKKRVKKILDKFCEDRIPDRAKDQIELDYNIRGNYVTLIEKRRYYKNPKEWIKQKIAQFRFTPEDNKWALYWWRHTGKWYKYKEVQPSNDLQDLVNEVDKDPTAIFWG